MSNIENISAKWLQSLKSPESGRVWYTDKELAHFHLCATSTGARIYCRVGRVNGKMTRVRLGTYPEISPKKAREMCETLNGDIAAGRVIHRTKRTTASARTLGEAYAWWLKYHAQPNKRTWERDARVWQRDVSHLANVPLVAVTRPDLIELVADVAGKYGPGAGSRVIELVRGIFSICIDNDWAVKNPAAKIPKHKPRERERFLQPSEVPAFFEALKTFRPRIQEFFLLCLFTGARRSNVMAMRWDEIDLDAWSWTIPDSKSKNKRTMTVSLAIPAIEILQRRAMNAGDSPWVFPSPASKTGHYVEPKDAWKRVCAKAGIVGLTIHDLRRTLGSWQAAQGVSMPIIGKSLGHVSPASTKLYARLAHDPVLLAVQNATDALQKAGEVKKSEKSPKSESD